MIKVILGFLLLGASLFASTRPEACGPVSEQWNFKSITSDQLPSAPADKALVVFVNRTKISTDPIFKIGFDGKWLAATKTKTYAYFTVEPGEHHFCGETGKKFRALMPLNAEAGKTYFIGNAVTADFLGQPKLEAVNEDQGRADIQRFKLAVSRPKN